MVTTTKARVCLLHIIYSREIVHTRVCSSFLNEKVFESEQNLKSYTDSRYVNHTSYRRYTYITCGHTSLLDHTFIENLNKLYIFTISLCTHMFYTYRIFVYSSWYIIDKAIIAGSNPSGYAFVGCTGATHPFGIGVVGSKPT